MMEILGYILLIGGAAFWAFAQYSDYTESKLKPFYGKEEGNRRYRNADGSFNAGKYALFVPLMAVGGAVGAYFATSLIIKHVVENATQGRHAAGLMAAGGWLAAIGAVVYIGYRANAKRSRENRIKQIVWRVTLKTAHANDDQVAIAKLLNVQTETPDIWHPYWTPWIKVMADSGPEAIEKLKPLMAEWLAIPASDEKRIWQDLTFHPDGRDEALA